jgi:hypothetical protein
MIFHMLWCLDTETWSFYCKLELSFLKLDAEAFKAYMSFTLLLLEWRLMPRQKNALLIGRVICQTCSKALISPNFICSCPKG